jgi:arylsulfatase A-like enzyme
MADWFPTLCELAGVEVPVDVPIDGISFAPRLLRGEPSRRRWVTGGIHGEISLFDGQWRWDHKSQKLTDARRLPREVVVPYSEHANDAAVQRLRAAAKIVSDVD